MIHRHGSLVRLFRNFQLFVGVGVCVSSSLILLKNEDFVYSTGKFV